MSKTPILIRGKTAGESRPRGSDQRMARSAEPVTIKRYGGGRLYNPVLGACCTLEELANMVEDDDEFVVAEASTGEDITRSVLRQIIRARCRHG